MHFSENKWTIAAVTLHAWLVLRLIFLALTQGELPASSFGMLSALWTLLTIYMFIGITVMAVLEQQRIAYRRRYAQPKEH